jgi:hypothetical protein
MKKSRKILPPHRRHNKTVRRYHGGGTKAPTIVLFTSSHGAQLGQKIPRQIQNDLTMLSFVSTCGLSGYMDDRPFDEFNLSIDELALHLTLEHFSVKKNKHTYESFKRIIHNDMPPRMRLAYEKAFEYDPEKWEIYHDGMEVVKPVQDRQFQFYPNKDEDPIYNVHYGLHIIDAGDLTQPLSQFKAFQDHPMDTLDAGNISEQRNPIIQNRIDALTDSEIKDYCQQIYDYLLTYKNWTLTDIYWFFTHLGFQKIFIIDPSCRDYSKDDIRSALRYTRPRKDDIPVDEYKEEAPRRGRRKEVPQVTEGVTEPVPNAYHNSFGNCSIS